jgi:hypothetical protein
LEKKLLIDLDAKNEAHELFKDLFGWIVKICPFCYTISHCYTAYWSPLK